MYFNDNSDSLDDKVFHSHDICILHLYLRNPVQNFKNLLFTLYYNVYQWCWLIIIYTCIFNFTFGPHLGPRVAQQSSVLHMVHAIQSHPYFFCSTILQEGHIMASPLRSNSYIYYRNHLSCSFCTVLPVQP